MNATKKLTLGLRRDPEEKGKYWEDEEGVEWLDVRRNVCVLGWQLTDNGLGCGAGMRVKVFTRASGWHTVNKKVRTRTQSERFGPVNCEF